MLNELQGDVVFCSGDAAVFVLGRDVALLAVEGADLDADFAVGCGDVGVVAIDADAAVLTDAKAEGAGFAEDELLEGRAVGGIAEDGEEGAGAPFFHDDGREHDVERALCEGGLGDVGEDLWGEVVECGFEDGDGFGVVRVIGFCGGFFGGDGVRCLVGFADAEAEDVGEVGGVASAGAVADVFDAHGGLLAEGGSDGPKDGCASWGDELLFNVGGVGGEAAEEVGGGGGGDGEATVGTVDHAAPDVDGGGVPLFDSESVDAGGGGDDVDDGVDRAYLVEVNFFDGYVVDLGFGSAE